MFPSSSAPITINTICSQMISSYTETHSNIESWMKQHSVDVDGAVDVRFFEEVKSVTTQLHALQSIDLETTGWDKESAPLSQLNFEILVDQLVELWKHQLQATKCAVSCLNLIAMKKGKRQLSYTASPSSTTPSTSIQALTPSPVSLGSYDERSTTTTPQTTMAIRIPNFQDDSEEMYYKDIRETIRSLRSLTLKEEEDNEEPKQPTDGCCIISYPRNEGDNYMIPSILPEQNVSTSRNNSNQSLSRGAGKPVTKGPLHFGCKNTFRFSY
eukprot:PhF_6_TR32387/c0_g1_i2/m.48045